MPIIFLIFTICILILLFLSSIAGPHIHLFIWVSCIVDTVCDTELSLFWWNRVLSDESRHRSVVFLTPCLLLCYRPPTIVSKTIINIITLELSTVCVPAVTHQDVGGRKCACYLNSGHLHQYMFTDNIRLWSLVISLARILRLIFLVRLYIWGNQDDPDSSELLALKIECSSSGLVVVIVCVSICN